jgi:ankyrin repeat protein
MKYNDTALMEASRNGHTATVQLLLGAGADKEAKSKVRET